MTSYVGLDVSLSETSVCVLDEHGTVRFEGRVPSQPEVIVRCVRLHAADAARIGLETGPTAGVLFRALTAAALPVVCLETRHAHRVLSDQTAKRLMGVPGIGHLTALAFIATIEDPARFRRSTEVGAYFGLTPRVHQSGEVERMGRITKAGDNLTRSYLVEAANVLLTRITRSTPLRGWGLGIVRRAGLKKAQIAVARKLAVMMHAIWSDGTEFEWRSAMA